MSESYESLPKVVKNRIEKKCQTAAILKKNKLVAHPFSKGTVVLEDSSTVRIGTTTYKDYGGGLLIEETPEDQQTKVIPEHDNAPIIEPDRPTCENCQKQFATSWLFEKFEYKCCDTCQDGEIHKLIPKTDAKSSYLLNDCDLEKRGTPLKFIKQKNPHNSLWGDMKLYLKIQVEQRALEVWGDLDKIEEEKKKRQEKNELAKAKKLEKRLKQLKKEMRSSLFDRTTAASHVHIFGEEVCIEEDTYQRKCTTCPYEETFEKM